MKTLLAWLIALLIAIIAFQLLLYFLKSTAYFFSHLSFLLVTLVISFPIFLVLKKKFFSK